MRKGTPPTEEELKEIHEIGTCDLANAVLLNVLEAVNHKSILQFPNDESYIKWLRGIALWAKKDEIWIPVLADLYKWDEQAMRENIAKKARKKIREIKKLNSK